MSKYIDTDVLIKDTIQEFINPKPFRDTIMRMINKAPSIDIVFCKECKYYHKDYTGEWCGRCSNPQAIRKTTADAFCSYGERRE